MDFPDDDAFNDFFLPELADAGSSAGGSSGYGAQLSAAAAAPGGGRAAQAAAGTTRAAQATGTGPRGLRLGAVNRLKWWMLSPEHYSHPWPSEAEKADLSAITGLTVKQVTVWFTNARKRVWAPIRAAQGLDTRGIALPTNRAGQALLAAVSCPQDLFRRDGLLRLEPAAGGRGGQDQEKRVADAVACVRSLASSPDFRALVVAGGDAGTQQPLDPAALAAWRHDPRPAFPAYTSPAMRAAAAGMGAGAPMLYAGEEEEEEDPTTFRPTDLDTAAAGGAGGEGSEGWGGGDGGIGEALSSAVSMAPVRPPVTRRSQQQQPPQRQGPAAAASVATGSRKRVGAADGNNSSSATAAVVTVSMPTVLPRAASSPSPAPSTGAAAMVAQGAAATPVSQGHHHHNQQQQVTGALLPGGNTRPLQAPLKAQPQQQHQLRSPLSRAPVETGGGAGSFPSVASGPQQQTTFTDADASAALALLSARSLGDLNGGVDGSALHHGAAASTTGKRGRGGVEETAAAASGAFCTPPTQPAAKRLRLRGDSGGGGGSSYLAPPSAELSRGASSSSSSSSLSSSSIISSSVSRPQPLLSLPPAPVSSVGTVSGPSFLPSVGGGLSDASLVGGAMGALCMRGSSSGSSSSSSTGSSVATAGVMAPMPPLQALHAGGYVTQRVGSSLEAVSFLEPTRGFGPAGAGAAAAAAGVHRPALGLLGTAALTVEAGSHVRRSRSLCEHDGAHLYATAAAAAAHPAPAAVVVLPPPPAPPSPESLLARLVAGKPVEAARAALHGFAAAVNAEAVGATARAVQAAQEVAELQALAHAAVAALDRLGPAAPAAPPSSL